MRKTPNTLAGAINTNILRQLAGTRSYEHGRSYFAKGRVGTLVHQDEACSAKVEGSQAHYRVRIFLDEGQLEYSCTCRTGLDGAFCKHAVAVGLAWLEKPPAPDDGKPRKRTVSRDEVRAYLTTCNKEELVGLLMQQAETHESLAQTLQLRTAQPHHGRPILAAFHSAIDAAVSVERFPSYGAMHDYAAGIERMIDAIRELLQIGHAAATIELAEYALTVVEHATGSVDDSDGHMGRILEQLQDLHYEACMAARPDPGALAFRLFEWELRSDWGTFSGAAERYGEVLGRKGLDAYRALAEKHWMGVSPLMPGDSDDDDQAYGQRFRITHIMETLARQSGNLEALIAVKARDLSSAYAFLQIAEACRDAGRRDLAVTWAQRGMDAFPDQGGFSLREFLANEYHQQGRHGQALALIWREFTQAPGLDRYQKLKVHADRIARWPDWRQHALTYLRSRASHEPLRKKNDSSMPSNGSDRSDLVMIFLWEKNTEAAWREAQARGCSEELWLRLAKLREKSHPEDALSIYQRQVELRLSAKSNEAYQAAVDELRTIRRLMQRLDREAEFVRYLETVRTAHRQKRNFVRQLEQVQW